MCDCIRKGEKEITYGYTRIAGMNGPHASMLMDFGILRLKRNQNFEEGQPLEHAYMPIHGEVIIQWEGKQKTIHRKNCFSESPWVLHAPAGTRVFITGETEDSEVTVHRTSNDAAFDADLYTPKDTVDEFRGAGTIKETCTRIVRTVFDKSNAPWPSMILDGVINIPDKWSSYPPRTHLQPEVYYYKFNPTSGYDFSEVDDDITKVHNSDAAFLGANHTHPQVVRPEYVLWYMWCIHHLDDNPYIVPYFLPEHAYIKEPGTGIWESKKR